MIRYLLSTLVTVTLFVACSPFKIAVSNELAANSRELPVKGRNGILIKQKLSFGEYRTTKVDRSWTEGQSASGGFFPVLWTTYSQKQQSIHFSLTDSSRHESQVFCLARVSSNDLTIGGRPNSVVNVMTDLLGLTFQSQDNYAVSIYLPREPNPWQMVIDMQEYQRNSKTYTGFLAQNRDKYFTLHPVRSLQKNGKTGLMPFGAIGFEIKNMQGEAVAAVSAIDNGVVYLAGIPAEERFIVANACAALLLHQTLD